MHLASRLEDREDWESSARHKQLVATLEDLEQRPQAYSTRILGVLIGSVRLPTLGLLDMSSGHGTSTSQTDRRTDSQTDDWTNDLS